MSPAPRQPITKEDMQRHRAMYSTAELLRMALGMLDAAAERGDEWLHNNTTLEVIRDRVRNPEGLPRYRGKS